MSTETSVNTSEYFSVHYLENENIVVLTFLKDLTDPEKDYEVSKASIDTVCEFVAQNNITKPIRLLADISNLSGSTVTTSESNSLFKEYLESDETQKTALVGLGAVGSLFAQFVLLLGKALRTKVAVFGSQEEAIFWLKS